MPLAVVLPQFPTATSLYFILETPPSIAAGRPQRRAISGVVWVLALLLALVSLAAAQDSRTVAWNANPEPDIEGYIVYLGTSSGEYVTIEDVGADTTHQFTGLSSSTQYYCAVQAYNTSGLTSDLSAEIVFTLQDVNVTFNDWASINGLNGANADPSAIPFNDGVRNMMKYAFNMNGAGPDTRTLVKGTGTAGLPAFSLNQSGAQPKFTVEYLRRKNSGLVYSPKTSTNLGNFVPMTGTSSVTNIDANWERVTLETSVNPSTTPKLFGIVEVSMP